MTRVCIVGVGLIGGSLGMALRRQKKKKRREYYVTGLGRHPGRLKEARLLGAIDSYTTNPRESASDADIIVFCVPVQSMSRIAKKMLPAMKPGAILTDAGSVKGRVVQEMKALLSPRNDLTFVGSHPLAGSEKTGIQNASPDLFKNSICVITRDGAKPDAASKVRNLWRSAGARCLPMAAAEHDRLLALTSHLPHLISFALFSQVLSISNKKPLIRSLVAGSFRDMTRVAGSDPSLWTGVMDFNRKNVMKAAREFCRTLIALAKARSGQFHRRISTLSEAKQSW